MSRIPLIKIAYNMIKEHPIVGVGTNTYSSVIHQYTNAPDLKGIYLAQVHNQYLLVFAEAGLIGIISFLWLMLGLFKTAASCISSEHPDNDIVYLGIGILLALIYISIHMMVDMYNGYILLANIFVLGSLATAGNRLSNEDSGGNQAE